MRLYKGWNSSGRTYNRSSSTAGVEAHKAGQVQEADRLYTAILKAQPKHPDANHNMGVLAVGVGKVEQALPFFKTALEANPATAQFWLSYIDALIKLDQVS
jgi:predicted Zn-dependent protease